MGLYGNRVVFSLRQIKENEAGRCYSNRMSDYRVCFMDHANRVFATEHFRAKSDQHAIEHAKSRYRTSIGKGYEIFREDQRIHIEIHPRSL